MAACLLDRLDGAAAPPSAHAARRAAGGRILTSGWLRPGACAAVAGSAATAAGCRMFDAEFRPLAAPAVAAAAAGAAIEAVEGAAAFGGGQRPPWLDMEPWEVEDMVASAVEAIVGQPVRGPFVREVALWQRPVGLPG
jgi:hypothetical protein